MFVAAVFTIARTLKWPKYPSRGMDKTYNGILLHIKRNKTVPFADMWMGL